MAYRCNPDTIALPGTSRAGDLRRTAEAHDRLLGRLPILLWLVTDRNEIV
jgi:hypothetical protein